MFDQEEEDDETDYIYVAAFEDVYDAVEKAHKDVGHGGEKKTLFEVKKKWSDITMEHCNLYIFFCEECHLKKSRKQPKGLLVNPIRFHSFLSRSQKYLINFQSLPDGDYKYILTSVNHLPSFVS